LDQSLFLILWADFMPAMVDKRFELFSIPKLTIT